MRGVRLAQRRVALVEGVAYPVVLEREDRRTVVVADVTALGTVLVYVVAEVDDEVQVLAGEGAQRGVVALRVVLAVGGGEAGGADMTGGRGTGPAQAARPAERGEGVVVRTAGAQTAHRHVHTVRERRGRGDGAARDDAAQGAVLGDDPADVDDLGELLLARLGERLGREARPEHDAGGLRVAGRDAERERRVVVRRSERLRGLACLRGREPGRQGPDGVERARGTGGLEQITSVEGHLCLPEAVRASEIWSA